MGLLLRLAVVFAILLECLRVEQHVIYVWRVQELVEPLVYVLTKNA
jgi:hypothetical protein